MVSPKPKSKVPSVTQDCPAVVVVVWQYREPDVTRNMLATVGADVVGETVGAVGATVGAVEGGIARGAPQVICTSSDRWQLWPVVLAEQSRMEASVPVQATSSSTIGSVPPVASPAVPPANPSWRHTTRASVVLKLSSQTVPHRPPTKTSSRPRELVPPTSLTPTVGAAVGAAVGASVGAVGAAVGETVGAVGAAVGETVGSTRAK